MSPQPDDRSLTPLATKPDFERCLARVEAWFHRAVLDRPPVRFYKHNAQFECGEAWDRQRWPSLEARWFDADYQLEQFEQAMAGKIFHAETFPVFTPNLGPNVYAAFYGGRLHFDEITSWSEPIVHDLDDLSAVRGDPFASGYFQQLERLTQTALARCRDRYWVGYTDLHPSVDCAAAWLGVDALFLAMVETPEKLEALLHLSQRDFDRIFEHFDRQLRAAQQPSVTWINLPCRERFHVPSCDVSSMFSPDYFRQFSLPLLQRELAHIDRAVYHVDGKGVARHLEPILAEPKIQAIQWVQGLGPDWSILQWIPLLKRVLAAGKAVMVDVPPEELEAFIGQMPREGVFLCLGVHAGEEEDILRRVARW